MSKTDIKKGDEVVVISGAEKGKRGKVVSYNRADERLTIEGLNLVKRHLKRTGSDKQHRTRRRSDEGGARFG